MLSIFSCAYWPCVSLLWRNVYLDLQSFFILIGLFAFLMLSFMCYLYIFEMNPLLVVLFANISPHSVFYLFVLFMVSLTVQKFLSLIRFHLFIIAFISITLGDSSKRILLQSMSNHSQKSQDAAQGENLLSKSVFLLCLGNPRDL